MKKYIGTISIILLLAAVIGILFSFCYAFATQDKEGARTILLLSLCLMGLSVIILK